jgi:hypothetical protein
VSVFLACASPQDSNVQREVARLHAPEKLVPAGEQVLFMARGEGVQIYTAEQQKDGKLQWGPPSPRADLLDYKTGDKIGTHSAGPTWTDNDGGTLVGSKVEAVEAPNADAVPWLLLAPKAAGSGRFSHVTHVQRLDTWGGKAPSTAAAKAGETREVHYEATYVFLGGR